jgi:hypothetical protein
MGPAAFVESLPRADVTEPKVPSADPKPATPAVLIKFLLEMVLFFPDMLNNPLLAYGNDEY